jgi:hypothetical protein
VENASLGFETNHVLDPRIGLRSHLIVFFIYIYIRYAVCRKIDYLSTLIVDVTIWYNLFFSGIYLISLTKICPMQSM